MKKDKSFSGQPALMTKTVILGAGHVAFHLSKALLANSIDLRQIYNRTEKNAIELARSQHIHFTTEASKIKKADLYIIATSDEAIEEVSLLIPFEDVLVVHTSGSVPMSGLKGKYRKGVFYPLQTLNREKEIDRRQIPFLIEAEEEKDLILLQNIAKKISGIYHTANSAQRIQAHLAAVWSCNFVNHLYHISQQLCQQARFPFQLLKPLILETAEKINALDPYQTQTGPAIRRDQKTIAKHLEVLRDEQQKNIYRLITESIIVTYEKLQDHNE